MTADRIGEVVRVVVGVDGSEAARHAAVWAAREAEMRDVPLTVVHACGAAGGIPPALGPIAHQEPRQVEARVFTESAAALAREQVPGLPVQTELSPLTPVEKLVELSGQGALIVTGTRGHGGILGVLLGSVSRALTLRARGPLVVVRGARAEDDEGPVVLGVGPEPVHAAVEYAFAAAQRHGAHLHAVRARAVLPADIEMPVLMPAGFGLRATVPPEVADHRRSEREHVAAREDADVAIAIEDAHGRYPGVHVEISTLEGDPAEILLVEAARARLVVIGRPHHHAHRPLPAGPGHVVGRLLSRCPAPVAVIPDVSG